MEKEGWVGFHLGEKRGGQGRGGGRSGWVGVPVGEEARWGEEGACREITFCL